MVDMEDLAAQTGRGRLPLYDDQTPDADAAGVQPVPPASDRDSHDEHDDDHHRWRWFTRRRVLPD